MAIYLVGLGPGDPGQLTMQAAELLRAADAVYLRTKDHPTVGSLPAGPAYHSFDDVYEQEPDFAAVYRRIVERLIELAEQGGDVVYAVKVGLDEQPPGLRWGMSVDVEIDTE